MGSTNPMVQHAQFFGLLGHPGCQERTSTKFWRQFRFFLTIAAKTINYGPRSNFIVALEKMQKSRIYIHLLYWLYQYLGFFFGLILRKLSTVGQEVLSNPYTTAGHRGTSYQYGKNLQKSLWDTS